VPAQKALEALGYTWEEMTAMSADQLTAEAGSAAGAAMTAAAAGEATEFDGMFVTKSGEPLVADGVQAWPVRVRLPPSSVSLHSDGCRALGQGGRDTAGPCGDWMGCCLEVQGVGACGGGR
jgi:hypothetical protein